MSKINNLHLIHKFYQKGPLHKIIGWPFHLYFVNDPVMIGEINANDKIYIREERTMKFLKMIGGENILNSDGEAWRKRRSMANPYFTKHKTYTYLDQLQASAEHYFKSSLWEKAVTSNEYVNINHFIGCLSLKSFGECFFSTSERPGLNINDYCIIDKLAASYEELSILIAENIFNILKFPIWWPNKVNKRLKEIRNYHAQVYKELIEDRISIHEKPDDLLTTYVKNYEENMGSFNYQDLVDEVSAMFFAGQASVTFTLSWFIYLLAGYPEEAEQLHNEINQVTRKYGQDSSIYTHLPLLKSAVFEAIRMHPAGYIGLRKNTQPTTLGGKKIPRNSVLFYSPYFIHRDEKYWENPEKFMPARFIGRAKNDMHHFAFIPFGVGRSHCIANNFSIIILMVNAVQLLKKYRFELKSNYTPPPGASTALRFKGGLPIKVSER